MRNLYFSDKVRSEQQLYDDIVIESLKIYGQDTYYLPRDLVAENRIFGEDVPSSFNSSYKLEMYVENIEGFDGEGDISGNLKVGGNTDISGNIIVDGFIDISGNLQVGGNTDISGNIIGL